LRLEPVLLRPRPAEQSKLDELLLISRRQSKDIQQIKQAYGEVRESNAFISSAFSKEREEKERLQEAIYTLTTHTKQLLQSQVYHKHEEGFRRFGLEVLESYLEKNLRLWDAKKNPEGVQWKEIAAHFPDHERSVIRRLNELSKRHTKDCKGYCSKCIYGFKVPPLKWIKPGSFLPNAEILVVAPWPTMEPAY
jgi:hypothetical protein